MGLFGFGKKKSTSKSSSQTANPPNVDDLPPIPVSDSSDATTPPTPTSPEPSDTGDVSSVATNVPAQSDSKETTQVASDINATDLASQQADAGEGLLEEQTEGLLEEQTEDNTTSTDSQPTSSSSQDLPRFDETPVEAPTNSLDEDGEPIFQESEFDFHDLFVEQERYIKAITDLKRTKHDFERRFAENTDDFIKPNEKTGRLLKKMKTKFMACNKNLLSIDTKLANQKL